MISVAKHTPLHKRSATDSIRLLHLDKLKQTLGNKNPYHLVQLTDDEMGINVDDMPDRNQRYKARVKFVGSIQFPFPVGLFTYSRSGLINVGRVPLGRTALNNALDIRLFFPEARDTSSIASFVWRRERYSGASCVALINAPINSVCV